MNQLTQTRQEEEEQGEMLIILKTGLHVCSVSNIPGEPIFVVLFYLGLFLLNSWKVVTFKLSRHKRRFLLSTFRTKITFTHS